MTNVDTLEKDAILKNKQNINDSYDAISQIYNDYRNLIRPFIAVLELFDSEFPVEILNEIRAIFQHLARCYYGDNNTNADKDLKKNLKKAEGHINRALLDCFKYSCLTLFDEYNTFMHLYRFVDLSSLDNGEFLKKLHRLKENAKNADKKARISEGDSGDDKVVFENYQKAFNASVELYKYMEHHCQYAANLKHKFKIRTFGAVLGWIVGIASGVYTLWTAIGDSIIQFFSK